MLFVVAGPPRHAAGLQVIKKSGSRGSHSPTCAYENFISCSGYRRFRPVRQGHPAGAAEDGTRLFPPSRAILDTFA